MYLHKLGDQLALMFILIINRASVEFGSGSSG
jgi:hypothetical protein